MCDEENKMDDGLKELLNRVQGNSEKTDESVEAEEKTEKETKKKFVVKNLFGKKKSRKKDESDEKAHKAFKQLTDLNDDKTVTVNLRTIIGGDVLAGQWFRRQVRFLLFLVVLAILYVTNRYAYQQEIIENKKLTLRLEDRRLRAVVATSNLTDYTRRGRIVENLSDTTLKSSKVPFYYLQTD